MIYYKVKTYYISAYENNLNINDTCLVARYYILNNLLKKSKELQS